MCGICGFSGRFDAAALERANAIQSHRGPDDAGFMLAADACVGLAHRRLSILDLSECGHQPMTSRDGSATIVFNGEIYNFTELRRELEADGYALRSHSDTEVLIELYARDGAAMLPRLNGIFAFAVWDARDRSVFVVRDALGVKPLYYAAVPRGVAFASEMKALLAMVPEARQLDAASIDRYLSFLWCPGEGTPLRDVRKLEPGEYLILREGRIAERRAWYELPQRRGVRQDLSLEASLAGTVEHLRSAAHRQMIADVPVGAFLSGGLDSSAIVTFAREITPDIQCFTIDAIGGDDPGMPKDLPYARRVAQHLGVPLHVVTIDATQVAYDLEMMIRQLDEPLADPAPLNVLYISRLARQHGMKVLLSGAGGDDLFTGYRRHTAVAYQRFWDWVPRGLLTRTATVAERLGASSATARRVAKLFENANVRGDDRLAAYFLWAREDRLRALYSPEFRGALVDEHATRPLLSFLEQVPASIDAVERTLALEQRFFLADHNLIYTDKMSMAAGVEVRVPFLDPNLVEFAARIPARFKQRGRTGKWILKRAMEAYLPRDVIYRAKTGFGAPLRRWMRNELRPLLGDLLSRESMARRGIFDPAAVQRLINDNQTGRIDAAYTLLAMLSVEIWCRAYVD